MKTLENLKKDFLQCEECTEYVSHNGDKCFRVFGSLSWYFLKCSQCGINPKFEDGYYTAKGNDFDLDYVERDIILAIH